MIKRILIWAIFLFFMTPVHAESLKSKVFVRIEGYDKTIASGEAEGYTFLEAVQKVADEKGISIVVRQSNDTKKIYSVNGINEKRFHSYDGWQGFIIRGGTLVQPMDIGDATLKDADEIVLYYGTPETYKIPSLELVRLRDKVTLSAVATYTRWVQNEKWEPVVVNEKIADINVHVRLPNGAEQIMRTNEEGLVKFSITMPGVYSYYAEGYTDTLPVMVKSSETLAVLGIADEKSLTRSEFVALLYTKMGLPTFEGTSGFYDLDSFHMYYNSMTWANKNGIISGYADNMVKPDMKITKLEAAIMLNNLYPDGFLAFQQKKSYANAPLWAGKHISFAIYKGFIKDDLSIQNVVSYQDAVNMLAML